MTDEWDRALEREMEDLNEEFESPWEVMLVRRLLPVIRTFLAEHAEMNYKAGEYDENMRLGDIVNKSN